MIGVDLLYTRVNQDLSRLSKSGYTSNEEFNRDLQQAEIVLMNFYHRQYEADSHIAHALLPFKKEGTLSATSGVASLPDDFKYCLNVYAYYIDHECGKTPAPIVHVPMIQLRAHNKAQVLSGGIYEPSLSKGIAWHELYPGQIKLYPTTVKSAKLIYLREPVTGVRAVTAVGDTDVYDADNSVDLEWPEQELGNFVSLLLFFKGIAVKETALISFAQGVTGALQASN